MTFNNTASKLASLSMFSAGELRVIGQTMGAIAGKYASYSADGPESSLSTLTPIGVEL